MRKIVLLLTCVLLAISMIITAFAQEPVSSLTTEEDSIKVMRTLSLPTKPVEPPEDCIHLDGDNLYVYKMNPNFEYFELVAGFDNIQGKEIKKVWMYFKSTAPTLLIFNDNNGKPKDIVYSKEVQGLSDEIGWKCITLNKPYKCNTGTTYVGFRVPCASGTYLASDKQNFNNGLGFLSRTNATDWLDEQRVANMGCLKLRIEVEDIANETTSPQPTENDTNTLPTREKLEAAQKDGKGFVPVKVYNSANAIHVDTMSYIGKLSDKVGLEVTNGDATFRFTGGFKVNEPGRIYYPLAYEQNSRYESDVLKYFAKKDAKTDTCKLGGEYTLPKAATITVKTTLPEGSEAYIYNYVAEPFPGKVALVGKAKVINGKLTFDAKTLGEFIFTTEKIG